MNRLFKHPETGKVEELPEHVADLFPDLIPVDDAGEGIPRKTKVKNDTEDFDLPADNDVEDVFNV